MEQVADFIKDLVEEMEDLQWQIDAVVQFEVVTEDNHLLAKVDEYSYKKQDNYYLEQWTVFEDSYAGTIIYPITDKLALKISYNC